MSVSPPFGQADLTNCERELIHLAGSIQPHGALLVARERDLVVEQASTNCARIFGRDWRALLGAPLAALGGDLAARVAELAAGQPLAEPSPLRCRVGGGPGAVELEASVHRLADGALVVEAEALGPACVETVDLDGAVLVARIGAAVERFSQCASLGTLCDAAVSCVRDLTGYDRVMVYKFDPDGHGKIVAEARHPRLESLLGHHYPASDIPQRARELYLRNRVRVLVDVDYAPAPIEPRHRPDGAELDMSMCYLRSMSPLHLQYLRNMGVTATLVVSLVRERKLWGLIACHHYAPRNLRYALRAACDLLAEAIATRIAAIENYAQAQVAIMVRRLEQRLIEATSTEGDWRAALFRNRQTLLQPLEATGAVLFFDDEIMTAGEVPSTPELRALCRWIDRCGADPIFSTASVERDNPDLASLTPTASGVLAVRLSANRPDYLVWLRKEQLQTVTWAGDPTKPVVVGNDPRELSPRRSFAAWSEIVRGTAVPWTAAELSLARAIGASLVDIILQVQAVRLLIAEHQAAQIRTSLAALKEPVIVADAHGRVLLVNEPLMRLSGGAAARLRELRDLGAVFAPADRVAQALAELTAARRPWRGDLELVQPGGRRVPVRVRGEVVPGRAGAVLGYVLIVLDQSDQQRAAAAREHLEIALATAARDLIAQAGAEQPVPPQDQVIRALFTNASLAAMDIAEATDTPTVPPLLEEVEGSARRAALLYRRIRSFAGPA
ncbi:MAG: GAF domain-containing protein [Burkholderiaceae bacterium]|nr:GAF domain-containing protein [Burkholderiaceae bacterium]